MLSRRDLLITLPGLCLALPPRNASSAEPWNNRHPDEWTPADIQDVLNRSPWGHDVTLNSTPNAEETAKGGKERRPGVTEFKVLVRWESSLPVRLARRAASPDKGADHYIVSITRLPMEYLSASSGKGAAGAAQDAVAAQLASTCTIDRAGKGPIKAQKAYWAYADFSPRVDIVFPREGNPIGLADWEATVSGRVGDFLLRARFTLKQMVYRGELEL